MTLNSRTRRNRASRRHENTVNWLPTRCRVNRVIGTSVVPEFSTIAVVVLAIAIVGIVIATARHGIFTFGPRM